MAELIDVACDVCGQKYRLDDERVGYSTTCRECGTKFKVVEYVPPPEPDATGNSPLPWIRGACVAALIVASLVGLGILPFYQPDPASRLVAANKPSPSSISQPASQTPQSAPAQSSRQKDVDAKVNDLRDKLSKSSIGRPPGMPGMPKMPGMPGTSGIPGSGTPGIGSSRPGMSGSSASGSAGASVPEQDTAAASGNSVGTATGVAPVITRWEISGGIIAGNMRLTGRGLRNVSKVQRLVGQSLVDAQFSAAGDGELEARQVIFGGKVPPLIVVSSPDGMAVAFADDIQTVDVGTPFESRQTGISVCRVRRGGALETDKLMVLLIESGGRAKVSSFTPLCFLEEGAELETNLAHKLIAAAGARITQRNPFPDAEVHPAVLTFCPLASPAGRK